MTDGLRANENDFIIGEIVNTQGVKGEVRVVPSTDDIRRFELLSEVNLTEQGGKTTVYGIEKVWYHKQFVVLKLAGIDDMEKADALKWAKIKIPPSLALPLGEDEYYERDLIGVNVVTESGENLGKLERVLRTGANDVYCVNGDDGEILIPAVKQCIKNVDTISREIIVRLLPSMKPEKRK